MSSNEVPSDPDEVMKLMYGLDDEQVERMRQTNQALLGRLERIAAAMIERTEMEIAMLVGDEAPPLPDARRQAFVANGGMVLFQMMALLASECSPDAAQVLLEVVDHIIEHIDGTADQG